MCGAQNVGVRMLMMFPYNACGLGGGVCMLLPACRKAMLFFLLGASAWCRALHCMASWLHAMCAAFRVVLSRCCMSPHVLSPHCVGSVLPQDGLHAALAQSLDWIGCLETWLGFLMCLFGGSICICMKRCCTHTILVLFAWQAAQGLCYCFG